MICKNCKFYRPSSQVKMGETSAESEPVDYGVCLNSKSNIAGATGNWFTFKEPNKVEGYKDSMLGTMVYVGELFGCIHFKTIK